MKSRFITSCFHFVHMISKDPELFEKMLRYIETFATNLDDAINEIVRDGQGISGRSARIKRRVDMILEEIQGLQMNLSKWPYHIGLSLFLFGAS